MYSGQCLCGSVQFRVDRNQLKLYQCHCSLCRKQSGTQSNVATIVHEELFQFTKGEDQINSWVKDSGFRSDFCQCCGSPVPNTLRGSDYVWIPAGLIEQDENMQVVSHIFLNSQAMWDKNRQEVISHQAFPGIIAHIANLE